MLSKQNVFVSLLSIRNKNFFYLIAEKDLFVRSQHDLFSLNYFKIELRWHVSGGGGKENIHLPIMLLERFIGGGVAAYIAGLEMHIHIYTLYIRVE